MDLTIGVDRICMVLETLSWGYTRDQLLCLWPQPARARHAPCFCFLLSDNIQDVCTFFSRLLRGNETTTGLARRPAESLMSCHPCVNSFLREAREGRVAEYGYIQLDGCPGSHNLKILSSVLLCSHDANMFIRSTPPPAAV